MGRRLGASVAAVALLASASVAEASTLRGEFQWSTRTGNALSYTYTAAPGEHNRLRITEDVKSLFRTTFQDDATLITDFPTAILDTQSGFPPKIAALCVPALRFVSCTSSGSADWLYATALLGDGADRALSEGPLTAAFLDGGAGDDTTGGGSSPEINRASPGADTILGGGGADSVTYSERGGGQTITLDGVANDGDPGEGDNVEAAMEGIAVGQSASTVIGDGAGQAITGGAGNDDLLGAGGADRIDGQAGDDILDAGDGADEVTVLGGADAVDGGAGDDLILLFRDSQPDQIACGDGVDRVRWMTAADPLDVIAADCEQTTS